MLHLHRAPLCLALLVSVLLVGSGGAVPASAGGTEPADDAVGASSDPDSPDPVSPVESLPGVGSVAHRGASTTAPENTLPAIRQAIVRQADFVGIDVHLTKDGVPVVLHDQDLKRTTDVEKHHPRRSSWPVNDFTLEQVKALDAGRWRSKIYAGAQVATLAEMLAELNVSDTGAFLEVKRPREYGGAEGIGAAVVSDLREHTDWLDEGGRNTRLVMQSFDAGFLEAFSRDYPDVAVGLLGVSSAEQMQDFPFATQINVNHNQLTPELVQEARQSSLAVSTWVVNDEARMAEVLALGVDAISTDRPAVLRRTLVAHDRVLDNDRESPPATPEEAELTIELPASAYAGDRVPVAVRLRSADGDPARWQWVRIEAYRDGRWTKLQSRVTDVNGSIPAAVTGRVGLRVRAVSSGSAWFTRSSSAVHRVDVTRQPTSLRLGGPATLVDEQAARLRIRWHTTNGRPVSGRANLWSRTGDRKWTLRRKVRVSDGTASLLVRPRRDTRYELRGYGGWWWQADRDRHRVDNVPPGQVVGVPVGAPAPRVRVAPQRRAVGAGANVTIRRIPRPVWDRMTGISWRRGCPVGRAGLRLVEVNYWGYDGYRHRGKIVVASAVARRTARVLTRLYERSVLVRSMHLVDRFGRSDRLRGGNATRSEAAGNSFGFNCQTVAGAPGRLSPRAWGRVLTLNPWENPRATSGGGSPNSWWLPRWRRSTVVHDDRTHPAVRAFRSEGARWARGSKRFAWFRF